MNEPLDKWIGEFGDAYTERNMLSPEVVRKRQNSLGTMIEGLPIKIVVEVGCNAGWNLKALQNLGYNVVGIEPNEKARDLATELLDPHRSIILDGNCYKIDWPDDTLGDLVLSAGLLIHVPNHRLDEAITEMLRVSNKYLLIIEYFAEEDEEIIYRGNAGMLRKRNWPQVFEKYQVSLLRSGSVGENQGFDDCRWYLYEKLVNL